MQNMSIAQQNDSFGDEMTKLKRCPFKIATTQIKNQTNKNSSSFHPMSLLMCSIVSFQNQYTGRLRSLKVAQGRLRLFSPLPPFQRIRVGMYSSLGNQLCTRSFIRSYVL